MTIERSGQRSDIEVYNGRLSERILGGFNAARIAIADKWRPRLEEPQTWMRLFSKRVVANEMGVGFTWWHGFNGGVGLSFQEIDMAVNTEQASNAAAVFACYTERELVPGTYAKKTAVVDEVVFVDLKNVQIAKWVRPIGNNVVDEWQLLNEQPKVQALRSIYRALQCGSDGLGHRQDRFDTTQRNYSVQKAKAITGWAAYLAHDHK